MIDFTRCWEVLKQHGLESWPDSLRPAIEARLDPNRNGNIKRWLPAFDQLQAFDTAIQNRQTDLNAPTIRITGLDDPRLQQQLKQRLQLLKPWRKGPFHILGTDIDTEWRSDWKWERVVPHLDALAGKSILDVGCGSGYHLWRMRGAGAEFVLGIDPSALFLMQFRMLQHFVDDQQVQYLPLAMEEITPPEAVFDMVFSMGVIYHRRSPIDHILQLKACLKPGGQLVLETLVIDSDGQNVLIPEERYAKMRNVWFLPSPALLCRWVERCGFTEVNIVDINATQLEEQRRTEWMEFESLADFLDPNNPALTVEGYPAPVRAVLTARLPD